MRPAVLFGVLGLGTVALLALMLLSPKAKKAPVEEPAAAVSPELPPESKPKDRVRSAFQRRTTSAPAQLSGHEDPNNRSQTAERDAEARAEQHETAVAARIAELRDLSSKTDPASWATLLSEIKNPDPEIRHATLDIVSQSGNRGAIPALEEAAAQTEDDAEKQIIKDAIEYLKLPTLTEVLSQTAQPSSNGTLARDAKPGVPRPPGTNQH
jgi:hypothetical protein